MVCFTFVLGVTSYQRQINFKIRTKMNSQIIFLIFILTWICFAIGVYLAFSRLSTSTYRCYTSYYHCNRACSWSNFYAVCMYLNITMNKEHIIVIILYYLKPCFSFCIYQRKLMHASKYYS